MTNSVKRAVRNQVMQNAFSSSAVASLTVLPLSRITEAWDCIRRSVVDRFLWALGSYNPSPERKAERAALESAAIFLTCNVDD